MHRATRRGRKLGERGFTLLGLSVVVFVLSALAVFAVPAWRRMTIAFRADAVAGELRGFATAFQAYAHDHADWPAAAAPGAIPPGMERYLGTSHWTRATPLGGRYLWKRDTMQRGERYLAVILVVPADGSRVTDDKAQLAAVDRIIDDGNLGTGKFRLGYRSQPMFVLEQ